VHPLIDSMLLNCPCKMQQMKHSSLAEGACNALSGWPRRFQPVSEPISACTLAKLLSSDEKDDGGVEGTRSMCRKLNRKLQWHEFSRRPHKARQDALRGAPNSFWGELIKFIRGSLIQPRINLPPKRSARLGDGGIESWAPIG
jgi:hypothetical protein